jgi:hypothetical protein
VWFKDAQAYALQKAVKLVRCSLCGTSQVERVPSGLHVGKNTVKPVAAKALPTSLKPVVQKERERVDPVVLMKSLQKYVKDHFVDVGQNFSERAIAMHRGEETRKPIYGTATEQEREQLDDEGISYLPLPKLSYNLDN